MGEHPDSSPESHEAAEQEAIAKAQAGDSEALEALFRAHYGPVLAFLRLTARNRLGARESVSDVAQSVCRLALRDIGRFEYQGSRSFRNWLLTYARNKVHEKLRQHHAGVRDVGREEFAPLSQIYGGIASPSRIASARETVEAFEQAFSTLSDGDRELIVLHKLEGLSHKEIATRTGKSVVACRQALSRAMVRLASAVARQEP